MNSFCLFLSLLLVSIIKESFTSNHVVVATYNLWNIMYHWDVRKFYIADMIRKVNADIVGFQDVRAHNLLDRTQIDELQFLLPQYKHKYYLPLENVDQKYYQDDGWQWRGVGFMSKFKISSVASTNLSIPLYSNDQRQRAILYSQFYIEQDELEINVIFVELSFDKQTQCSNAYEVVKYIYSVGVESLVVMGDFHVYEEFNIPLKAIANGYFDEDNQYCKNIGSIFNQQQYRSHDYKFTDAWVHRFSLYPGFTYSNLPSTGFVSRPDRILVSKVGIKIESAMVLGKGELYEHKRGSEIYWNRYWTVLNTAHNRDFGREQNSTCLTDCGPHTSCRCGICIKGAGRTCKPKECMECTPSKLFLFHLIMAVFGLTSFYFFGIIIVVILSLVRPRWNRFFFNKLKLRRVAKCSYFGVSFCIIIFTIIYATIQFDDVKRLVDLQPMDELNPSSHLMVVAKLELV